MLSRVLSKFFITLNDIVHKPGLVLSLCLGLAFWSLVVDGSLWSLWKLHRDKATIEAKVEKVQADSKSLSLKLKSVNDPKYIQKEAIDRFNLASEGDLIFIFSNED